MDNAQQTFQRLIDGGLSAIRAFVDDQQEEHLYLDFKQAADGHGPANFIDRQHLAEALSGFANSDGGVIVWGIKCKPGEKGDPDVASDFKPIGKLTAFFTDLQNATAQVVAPAVLGVQHIRIPDESGQDQGYVVTFVPRSEGEPHMARAKDQHRFYYRSGSSFLKMEPFMLADRYGRRPHPKLKIACLGMGELDASKSSATYSFILKIGVRNEGVALGLHPLLKSSTMGLSTFTQEPLTDLVDTA